MKKRNVMILILLLAIGFASISTTLILNGIVKIGENSKDFDVYFSNAIEDGVENKKLIKDDTHLEFTKDMSIVGETYELEYDVTNGSRNYDANITINCTKSNEYVSVINEFDTTSYLNATETRRGKLTIELLKPYIGTTEKPTKEISITCEIVVTDKERESLGEGTPADKVKQSSWTITEDNDNNGEVSQRDLITLGSESFHVYDIEGDNVKAISQYNLYVGNIRTSYFSSGTPLENPTGLQDSRAIGQTSDGSLPFIGVVPFTTDEKYNASNVVDGGTLKRSDYSISTIKEQVDGYASVLSTLNANITNIRLITKEELETLGCDSNNNTCSSAPSYITSTTYWTMSPTDYNDSVVLHVLSSGSFSGSSWDTDSALGVRPVIEISKSLFE